MASNIDPSQPPATNPTTAGVRANMQAAKAEIEALQAAIDSTATGYLQLSPGYFIAAPTEVILLPASPTADGTRRTIEIANTPKLSGEYPPNNAKSLLLNLDIAIKARGSEGFHEMNIYVCSNDSGSQQGYNMAIAAWEPAGMAPNTWFAGDQRVLEFPVIGPNLKIAYFLSDLPGGTSPTVIQGWRIVGFRR